MTTLLTSKGLLQRLDLSSSNTILALIKTNSFEISGTFLELEDTGEYLKVGIMVSASNLPFKLIGFNDVCVIIKNSIETINIQMKISKFKISNTKNLKILLEAENYEIKYI